MSDHTCPYCGGTDIEYIGIEDNSLDYVPVNMFFCGGCQRQFYGDAYTLPDRDEVERLVAARFAELFPPGSAGPGDDFDIADLYYDAEMELLQPPDLPFPDVDMPDPEDE